MICKLTIADKGHYKHTYKHSCSTTTERLSEAKRTSSLIRLFTVGWTAAKIRKTILTQPQLLTIRSPADIPKKQELLHKRKT